MGNRFGRCLEDDERARLLEACDQSTVWPDLGLFVRTALATGARRREIERPEWRDVDLKGGSILLRETRNGDDRRVPLLGDVRVLSCGSYLAKAGASAFQIAAILGHRSGPGLTACYVHLVAEDSRELLEAGLDAHLVRRWRTDRLPSW